MSRRDSREAAVKIIFQNDPGICRAWGIIPAADNFYIQEEKRNVKLFKLLKI